MLRIWENLLKATYRRNIELNRLEKLDSQSILSSFWFYFPLNLFTQNVTSFQKFQVHQNIWIFSYSMWIMHTFFSAIWCSYLTFNFSWQTLNGKCVPMSQNFAYILDCRNMMKKMENNNKNNNKWHIWTKCHRFWQLIDKIDKLKWCGIHCVFRVFFSFFPIFTFVGCHCFVKDRNGSTHRLKSRVHIIQYLFGFGDKKRNRKFKHLHYPKKSFCFSFIWRFFFCFAVIWFVCFNSWRRELIHTHEKKKLKFQNCNMSQMKRQTQKNYENNRIEMKIRWSANCVSIHQQQKCKPSQLSSRILNTWWRRCRATN